MRDFREGLSPCRPQITSAGRSFVRDSILVYEGPPPAAAFFFQASLFWILGFANSTNPPRQQFRLTSALVVESLLSYTQWGLHCKFFTELSEPHVLLHSASGGGLRSSASPNQGYVPLHHLYPVSHVRKLQGGSYLVENGGLRSSASPARLRSSASPVP